MCSFSLGFKRGARNVSRYHHYTLCISAEGKLKPGDATYKFKDHAANILFVDFNVEEHTASFWSQEVNCMFIPIERSNSILAFSDAMVDYEASRP